MQADIDNKQTDTRYKQELTHWEPWKMLAVAVGSTAALFGVLGGAIGWLLRSVH